MLEDITPVVLVYNEEANIGRTLTRLRWARDVVVVDSGSIDATRAIVSRYPNTRLFERAFDSHGEQWRYAIEQTQIKTDWIIRLDADYQLTDELVRELDLLDLKGPFKGYCASFDYAIYGHRLISSLYPPNTILLKKGCFTVYDRGHTEVWNVDGSIGRLKGKIVHDDRKAVTSWLIAQQRYMQRELDQLSTTKTDTITWLRRRPPLMPLAALVYCLFVKGLILDGRAGIFYALQRVVAESILSLMVLEYKLRRKQRSPHE
jgi:glycosyltransferase involved in cell wall biosynthesis